MTCLGVSDPLFGTDPRACKCSPQRPPPHRSSFLDRPPRSYSRDRTRSEGRAQRALPLHGPRQMFTRPEAVRSHGPFWVGAAPPGGSGWARRGGFSIGGGGCGHQRCARPDRVYRSGAARGQATHYLARGQAAHPSMVPAQAQRLWPTIHIHALIHASAHAARGIGSRASECEHSSQCEHAWPGQRSLRRGGGGGRWRGRSGRCGRRG